VRSKTIGTGGDYADVGAWEASIADVDDETGTAIESADITTGLGVTLNPANTGPWAYLLTADASNAIAAATYASGSSKARLTTTLGSALVVSGTGWTVEKLAIFSTAASLVVDFQESGTLRRFYVRNTLSGNGIILGTAGKALILDNGIVEIIGTLAVAFGTVVAATVTAYQVSVLMPSGGYAGVYVANGTVDCYGVMVQGSASDNWRDDGGGTFGGDYNLSQNTDAPGANSVHSTSGLYTNTTATSEDFALTSSPAFVDRTGFPTDTDTDIVGTTRPATGADPGVWQTPPLPAATRPRCSW